MTEERWLPVVGYEGLYEVSDLGRVRSLDRVSNATLRKGRILRQSKNTQGRFQVGLHRDRRQTSKTVHKLVLEAFVGQAPPGLEACHNNGNHEDNRLENLRWDTKSSNVLDQVRHGQHLHARKTRCPAGHLYEGDNVRPNSRGNGLVSGRTCIQCARDQQRARQSVGTPQPV